MISIKCLIFFGFKPPTSCDVLVTATAVLSVRRRIASAGCSQPLRTSKDWPFGTSWIKFLHPMRSLVQVQQFRSQHWNCFMFAMYLINLMVSWSSTHISRHSRSHQVVVGLNGIGFWCTILGFLCSLLSAAFAKLSELTLSAEEPQLPQTATVAVGRTIMHLGVSQQNGWKKKKKKKLSFWRKQMCELKMVDFSLEKSKNIWRWRISVDVLSIGWSQRSKGRSLVITKCCTSRMGRSATKSSRLGRKTQAVETPS